MSSAPASDGLHALTDNLPELAKKIERMAADIEMAREGFSARVYRMVLGAADAVAVREDDAMATVLSPYPLAITPDDIEAHADILAKWLEANGIDPYAVSRTHPLRVEDGDGLPAIRYRHIVRDEHGHAHADPIDPDQVHTVQVTAPCLIPPPHLGTPSPPPHPEAHT